MCVGMKKFTTVTHANGSITIFHLVKQTWEKSLKYNGAVMWNNILKLGINPNISVNMFAKKLKHVIIKCLLWITRNHNLHWAIKFATNKRSIACCCNLSCTLFQQMLQNSGTDMQPINLTGFTLPLLLFAHDVWSLHALNLYICVICYSIQCCV